MNGHDKPPYSFQRIEDEDINRFLALAVGFDQEARGGVIVDLVVGEQQGAYRFTPPQFLFFARKVQAAADLGIQLALILDCMSDCVADEDEAVMRRVMENVGVYMRAYAQHMSGDSEPDDEEEDQEEDEIPFAEL